MSKAITIIMMTAGILMLFAFLGIGDSATSALLTALSFGSLTTIKSGEFWVNLFGTSAGALAVAMAGAGIAIGYLTKSSPIEYIIASAVMALGGWVVGDLLSILATVEGSVGSFTFVTYIAKFIIVLLCVGVVLSLISYWRGSDG